MKKQICISIFVLSAVFCYANDGRQGGAKKSARMPARLCHSHGNLSGWCDSATNRKMWRMEHDSNSASKLFKFRDPAKRFDSFENERLRRLDSMGMKSYRRTRVY